MHRRRRGRGAAGRAGVAAVRAVRAVRLAGLILLGSACAEPPERPDVLVVTVDTLRADHLGAYGYETARTPVLDRLARRGLRFEEAVTPFPRTTPALASLFTGLRPAQHGSREVGDPMERGRTLAQILRDAGYATAAVSANGNAGARQNLDRGFERFRGQKSLGGPEAANVTRAALELAEAAPRSQPLLLWVHYLDPHFPYGPPRSFDAAPRGPRCRRLARRTVKGSLPDGFMESNRDGVAERALSDCVALYDAEIAYADRAIGRLLEGLRGQRGLEGSWIVFTSDHGENLGEWGLYYEHGPNLHEASLRVPLVLAGPGVRHGTDRRLIRLEDVLPTLLARLDLSGAETPETAGVDLSARLSAEGAEAEGERRTRELVALAESGSALSLKNFDAVVSGHAGGRHCVNGVRFSLCGSTDAGYGLFDVAADPHLRSDRSDEHPEARRALERAAERWPPESARQRAVRSRRFKLVESPQLEGGYRRALYDLEGEAGEGRDVRHEHPEVAERLGTRLERWTADLPPPRAPARDEGQLEALRALGYVR